MCLEVINKKKFYYRCAFGLTILGYFVAALGTSTAWFFSEDLDFLTIPVIFAVLSFSAGIFFVVAIILQKPRLVRTVLIHAIVMLILIVIWLIFSDRLNLSFDKDLFTLVALMFLHHEIYKFFKELADQAKEANRDAAALLINTESESDK